MKIDKNKRLLAILVMTIFFPITFAGMFLYMIWSTCASVFDELTGNQPWQK
jgi:membrane protein insertase Oxa1/YidC/SpoIIIJ